MKTASEYSIKELNSETWSDFEELFGKYGGVQAGCWCMFYQRTGPISGMSWEGRVKKNHSDKGELVRSGCAHGILVYANGKPIGWCQYGPKEELPRIDFGRNYKKLALPDAKGKRLWRITCFFVDKEYRKKGISQIALHAALNSIGKKGGGVIEAYPATNARAVAIWFGTVGMFEREGFRRVAVLGRSNIVMRRDV